MSDEPLTVEEFTELTMAVTDAMTAAFRPTVTPLSGSSEEFVRLIGTGTYLAVDGMRVIVTCRHVIEEGGTNYGFHYAPEIFEAGNQVVTAENRDVALINVPDFIWDRQKHETALLTPAAFAERHDPVDGEVFFLCGFAGENSRYGFDMLDSTATAYCTQVNKAAELQDRFFYLTWNPGQAEVTPGTDATTAKYSRAEVPRGLSGALVWDTGFIRTYDEDRPWSPADARVTGLVTSWDQHSGSLVARRIEDVREWLAATLGSDFKGA